MRPVKDGRLLKLRDGWDLSINEYGFKVSTERMYGLQISYRCEMIENLQTADFQKQSVIRTSVPL